jgi:hypothetical protein
MINNPKKMFLRSRRYIDLYYRTLQPNFVRCYDTTLNKMGFSNLCKLNPNITESLINMYFVPRNIKNHITM